MTDWSRFLFWSTVDYSREMTADALRSFRSLAVFLYEFSPIRIDQPLIDLSFGMWRHALAYFSSLPSLSRLFQHRMLLYCCVCLCAIMNVICRRMLSLL